MKRFMSRCCEMFDLVFIDTPPVILVSEATILARLADACVLVVQGLKTRKKAIRQTMEALQDVAILGFVLNQMEPDAAVSTRYSDYYSYKKKGPGQ